MIAVNEKNLPITKINSGDVIVFFNYRTDRGRQLTEALSQVAFPKNEMVPLDLHFVTLTSYNKTFKKVNVVFEKDNLNDTLGETLSKAGKSQIRIAETEKYPHVTFFLMVAGKNLLMVNHELCAPHQKYQLMTSNRK